MIIRSKKVLVNDKFIPANIEIKGKIIESIKPYDSVKEAIDVGENLVLPGIVDLHSDALEKEIEPRPNANFPLAFAFKNLDKKLAMAGITTMYHAIGFEENPSKHRNSKLAREQIELLTKMQRSNEFLVDNLIHARFEISSLESLDDLYECFKSNLIDILSIMDHTPGQGQFKSIESLANYYRKHHGWSEDTINELMQKRIKEKDWECINTLLQKAKEKHIALLSHDDDCKEKLDMLIEWGIRISEFPLSLEVAKYAKLKGSITGMGAPNVVRGGSQSGNVSAQDLIKEGACSYLCSDYHPSSMLLSAFIVAKNNAHIPLEKAYAMISSTPAKAVGLNDRGEIKEGKNADILVVKEGEIPEVLWCIKNGKSVYSILDFKIKDFKVDSKPCKIA